MIKEKYREIPYNFTSADDRLIINHLFGKAVWDDLEELRSQRITGRSARLVMRFMGDLFILGRNPFLYQELIDSTQQRQNFVKTAKKDLSIIEKAVKEVGVGPERSAKVLNLVKLCRNRLNALKKEIASISTRRTKIRKKLGAIIGHENIAFDPFSLISHATDATDWRLHLPIAILRPGAEEQVPQLLEAVAKLGLHVIPRGGGTGLTGGCVPLSSNCVIINTEKLNRIHDIKEKDFQSDNGSNVKAPVLHLEAGVITQDAMTKAEEKGLVFATDPTSAWASTIGGNIAENAGGKTAVLWGTAIDNLYSYSIAMPGGIFFKIQRINHPLRKILPEDTVVFEVLNPQGKRVKEVKLEGNEIRKKGLWKDITNKALGGLPGIQKEGTDGIITSAEFVLYKAYEKKVTFCLEFFGEDMDEASKVIVKISEEFVNKEEEALIALEHFDQEYIRAINYKFKAARSEHPKAVLLIDMVAHTNEQQQRGIQRLSDLLEPYVNTELFTARDQDEAMRFWRDRKRLGAIAARTNAFKLNEDIVLPLPALAKFARFVDEYNIEEDIHNKKHFIHITMEYLDSAEPIEDPDWLEAKLPKAYELCQETLEKLELRTLESIRHAAYIKRLMEDLLELFRGYERVSANIEEIYDRAREKRIVIATHMHAGDGNVHVNIPVFSNDRQMMKRAEKTAEDVMAKAIALDGVVSGEHGIGITKMKFLDEKRREELIAYRKKVDPQNLMNPGMLNDPEIIDKVFTPSFNLLELEARILQHRSLEALSSKIAQCVRCGKCKSDCCVFFPGSNIFFHPRNKNLAIGSLIEALLYDMQRTHHPRFNKLRNLEEIADHCTMCGKCLSPCPVNINTAEVSVMEREILGDLGYKHTPLATKLSLHYLENRGTFFNGVFRKTVVDWGGRLQRFGVKSMKKAPAFLSASRLKPLNILRSPMQQASKATLRSVLPTCSGSEALILQPEDGDIKKTVLYFPGCGSERLYSEISMAAIYILLKSNIRIVLPPPFLCCGFPAKVNAKKKMYETVTLRDTIILSQIREMLGHIIFDAFVVSCGTCREALAELGFGDIFGCHIKDISSFTFEHSPDMFPKAETQHYLYHAPCHDSLDGEGNLMVQRVAGSVTQVPNCCSEAGTMAISRPDISHAMLKRKQEALQRAIKGKEEVPAIITNCPSCISGLGRNKDLNITPLHLTVLLAQTIGGENWQKEFPALLGKTETVTF